MLMYPIIDISDQDIDNIEQMGTKSKFWYTDSKTKEEFLFKSIHTEDGNGNPVERKGEDWAEKIACEIASKLNIPHAHYDLATYQGQRGIRSKNFTNKGDNLFFGNQLIEEITSKIKIPLESGQKSQKIERIIVILQRIIKNPPPNWQPTKNITTAIDVFLGYLMLDTVISNQDRHNENWAMLIKKDNSVHLSPSFDHAASLGRNESEEEMHERLTTNNKERKVPHYVKRCKSYFYNDDKRLKTLDAFIMFSYFRPKAALEWLSKLEQFNCHEVKNIINKIPSEIMTDTAKDFCLSIILANRERILLARHLIMKMVKD